MDKRLIFVAILLINAIAACQKDIQPPPKKPCIPIITNLVLPTAVNLECWSVLDSSLSFKYLKAYSNTGLTQTYGLSRPIPFFENTIGCNTTLIWNFHHNYKPNLYGSGISTITDYSNDQMPNLSGEPIIYDTSKVTFTIVFNNYLDTTNWPLPFYLSHVIYPSFSTKLTIKYYIGLFWNGPYNFECDTCIKFLGTVQQGSKIYDETYRYLNPVELGPDSAKNAISWLLYDRKAGLISYGKRNGEIWNLESQ
jgi:hypothetical protein